MRVLLYNPPSAVPMIRRYMCSYNAGENRYPCLELLSLAAVARSAGHEVAYLDAVAENLPRREALSRAAAYAPDLTVSLLGLECLHEDLAEVRALKQRLPAARVGVAGYYPSREPEKCLAAGLDFVLRNEPERGLLTLLAGTAGEGLALQGEIGAEGGRLGDGEFAALPIPAHDLLKPELYYELGLGKRLATVQLTRGCPYPCTYCLRSFGRQTVRRRPEQVVAEFVALARLGFRTVRLLDDTFNLESSWTEEVCRGLIAARLPLRWSALSRVDTLRQGELALMRQAGCRRLFIGIESGSQAILDLYGKGYRADAIAAQVRQVRRAGLEAVGFFLLGAPGETRTDVLRSIDLAKQCDLDHVIATKLVLYPGTELASRHEELAMVDPWKGVHRFRDEEREAEIIRWEREFYREFYFSRRGVRTGFRTLLRDPGLALRALGGLAGFIWGRKSDRVHPDYL